VRRPPRRVSVLSPGPGRRGRLSPSSTGRGRYRQGPRPDRGPLPERSLRLRPVVPAPAHRAALVRRHAALRVPEAPQQVSADGDLHRRTRDARDGPVCAAQERRHDRGRPRDDVPAGQRPRRVGSGGGEAVVAMALAIRIAGIRLGALVMAGAAVPSLRAQQRDTVPDNLAVTEPVYQGWKYYQVYSHATGHTRVPAATTVSAISTADSSTARCDTPTASSIASSWRARTTTIACRPASSSPTFPAWSPLITVSMSVRCEASCVAAA